MNNTKYERAYTEVLEIISYFPQEEYSKIPSDIIEYYKNNMDKNYNFSINPEISLEEQNISKEAFAIIVSLFRDYFATDKQKETLKSLLKQNQEKKDKELREKYNPDDIFKNRISSNQIEDINGQAVENEKSMTIYKESIITKIWNFIKGILKK